MKASEILADPKDWVKGPGHAMVNDEPCCALIAIFRMADQDHEKALILANRVRKFLSITSITAWNDAPERTHAEIIQVLKACDL